MITRGGSQAPSAGPAEYFTGKVRVQPLFSKEDAAAYGGAYVTFEPSARSAWHIHPAGQRLVVTEGFGRTQQWGGPVEEIRAGDVVWCPPGVKHWHGASPTSAMTHLALTGVRDGKTVEWLERSPTSSTARATSTMRTAAWTLGRRTDVGRGEADNADDVLQQVLSGR
jgi:quercetin dioxygenase-like cupin family protein